MEFRTHCRVWAFTVYLLATALARAMAADPSAPAGRISPRGWRCHRHTHRVQPPGAAAAPVRLQRRQRPHDEAARRPVHTRRGLTPPVGEERPRFRLRQRAHPGGHAAEGARRPGPGRPARSPRSARRVSRKPTIQRPMRADPEEIVRITGTYIRDKVPVGQEIISANRDDIEATGAADAADFLSHPATDFRRRPQPGHLHRPGGADELRPRRRREPPRVRCARDAGSHRRTAASRRVARKASSSTSKTSR